MRFRILKLEVVGALTSILGLGYVMLPHRHCHLNAPVEPLPDGRRGITMVPHRDGQAGCHKPRHQVPQWALLFYYPQECPDRQGPTALIPGADAQRATRAMLPGSRWRSGASHDHRDRGQRSL